MFFGSITQRARRGRHAPSFVSVQLPSPIARIVIHLVRASRPILANIVFIVITAQQFRVLSAGWDGVRRRLNHMFYQVRRWYVMCGVGWISGRTALAICHNPPLVSGHLVRALRGATFACICLATENAPMKRCILTGFGFERHPFVASEVKCRRVVRFRCCCRCC